jgi:hypothetical protein
LQVDALASEVFNLTQENKKLKSNFNEQTEILFGLLKTKE